jgi:transcriptional regulator with XRE-family HTH domain
MSTGNFYFSSVCSVYTVIPDMPMPKRPLERKKKMGPRMKAAAARVKEWFDESGMTETQLADHVGIKQSSINSFLHGKNATSVDNLALIAEALGRDLCDVFEEVGPKASKYVMLVTAWNALPNQQARTAVLDLMKLLSNQSPKADQPPPRR